MFIVSNQKEESISIQRVNGQTVLGKLHVVTLTKSYYHIMKRRSPIIINFIIDSTLKVGIGIYLIFFILIRSFYAKLY